MAAMTNRDAAAVLFNVATILELTEDNPYRVRAYRRAGQLLLNTEEHAGVYIDERRELDMPGLGSRLRQKLGELFTSGRMKFYVELGVTMPDSVRALARIPGIGPKTAFRLHEELGLTSAAEVAEAATLGKIRELYGFGAMRERRLLEGATQPLSGYVKPFVPLEDPLPERLPSNILPLPWIEDETLAEEAA